MLAYVDTMLTYTSIPLGGWEYLSWDIVIVGHLADITGSTVSVLPPDGMISANMCKIVGVSAFSAFVNLSSKH